MTQIVEVGRHILPPDLINVISELVIELRHTECQELREKLYKTCNTGINTTFSELEDSVLEILNEILDNELLTQEMCLSFDWFNKPYTSWISYKNSDFSLLGVSPEEIEILKEYYLRNILCFEITYFMLTTD